ncbi:MAG: hypothetical protein ACJAT7_003219 [Psychromonas sp.]|jgi:hypothetical protein|uniref:hypothetical protein n=1 Tax=Psychromonas sp. TaxID=1884585 RepID=UPI0039E6B543
MDRRSGAIICRAEIWDRYGPLKLARKRTEGDNDYFQLGQKGNQSYYVSLDLHLSRQEDERRVKQLQHNGFSVKIQPIYIQQAHYWLSVNGQFSLLDLETLQKLADATLGTDRILCTSRRPLSNNI